MLDLSVAIVGLVNEDRQRSVRHPIKDVPHRLLARGQDVQDLLFELGNLIGGTPIPFYRTCTISGVHGFVLASRFERRVSIELRRMRQRRPIWMTGSCFV